MIPASLHVNRLSWKDIGNRDAAMMSDFIKEIEAIQLDSMQEGMRRAAAICTNEELLQPITDSERNTAIACEFAITEAANNLTVKDL